MDYGKGFEIDLESQMLGTVKEYGSELDAVVWFCESGLLFVVGFRMTVRVRSLWAEVLADLS